MLKIGEVPKKFRKKSRKILEKSLNLEIEYIIKYNSFFTEFSPLEQEFNPLSFHLKISKIMRKN